MHTYSLKQLGLYFLRLGSIGFGGPVALVGYMNRDLVEDKKWISEEEYKEGLTLAQLMPGPLAAQLSIYIGYVHYGTWGAAVSGVAFVLPSFVMVLLLGIAYKMYGGLPWMQAVFYGVGAAVIGIIIISVYKLTTKSIGKPEAVSIRKNWLLWLFFLTAAIVTAVTEREEVLLFIIAGLIYMVVKAPPGFLKGPLRMHLFLLSDIGFWNYDIKTLKKIAWYFTEAGAFVFGSGLAIVPFLHAGVVEEYGWLTEQQFVDSVAVAMITPGPVVITVGFIGYLVAGFPGAVVASLCTFLPCFLFTVLPAPYFQKIAKNKSIRAFVDGITAAVVGALAGALIVIATRTITDVYTALIAIAVVALMIYKKRFPEPLIILAAAVLGLILKL